MGSKFSVQDSKFITHLHHLISRLRCLRVVITHWVTPLDNYDTHQLLLIMPGKSLNPEPLNLGTNKLNMIRIGSRDEDRRAEAKFAGVVFLKKIFIVFRSNIRICV